MILFLNIPLKCLGILYIVISKKMGSQPPHYLSNALKTIPLPGNSTAVEMVCTFNTTQV